MLNKSVEKRAAELRRESDATATSSTRTVIIVAIIAALVGIVAALWLTRSVVRPVAVVVDRLRSLDERDIDSLRGGLAALADGDLTVEAVPATLPIEDPRDDEVGGAARTTNSLIDKTTGSLDDYNRARAALGEMFGQVADAAAGLSASSQEMASTSDEAGRAVGEIAHAVSEVAAGAERQVRMVESTRAAEESQDAAGRIATLIDEIQRQTRRVVDVVDEGSRRTNDGVSTVEQARTAFESIGAAVEDVSARVAEIAAAVPEISANADCAETDILSVASVAEQSSASAEQVSASTQQTSASTQQISSCAAELARTAEHLTALVSRFKIAA